MDEWAQSERAQRKTGEVLDWGHAGRGQDEGVGFIDNFLSGDAWPPLSCQNILQIVSVVIESGKHHLHS